MDGNALVVTFNLLTWWNITNESGVALGALQELEAHCWMGNSKEVFQKDYKVSNDLIIHIRMCSEQMSIVTIK